MDVADAKQGFVLSDWGALYGGLEYAAGGLDMGMPDALTWQSNLVQAVQTGSFPESRVTDMATRSASPAININKLHISASSD